MIASHAVQTDFFPDLCKAVTHYSHLSYSDFCRTEKLTPWSLSLVFESARHYGLTKGLMDFPSLASQRLGFFILGKRYQFHPQLWLGLTRRTIFPFTVSAELTHMGQTSVVLSSRLVNSLDNQELGSCQCKVVYIDRDTRRPIPLPQSVTGKYADLIPDKQNLVLPSLPAEVPASAFSYTCTVAPSDCDFNQHVNQSCYVRFCCDAAQMAVRAGRLPGFTGDIGNYPLKELVVVYVGESAVEDLLRVLLWQQPGEPFHINLVIQKIPNNSVIFHGSMTYGHRDLTPPSSKL